MEGVVAGGLRMDYSVGGRPDKLNEIVIRFRLMNTRRIFTLIRWKPQRGRLLEGRWSALIV